MTGSEFATHLRARRVGRGKWVAKCPAHPDKNGSLYITAGKEGGAWPHCFAGCSQQSILDALGMEWGDLQVNREPDPFWQQQQRDREHLELLERQEGLAIMAQAVYPDEREHWAEVESTCALEARELRDRLEPEQAKMRKDAAEVQRIIAEYGIDELVECLPEGIGK